MMENNLILLLTLTGLSFQYEWLRTERWTPLLIGSARARRKPDHPPHHRARHNRRHHVRLAPAADGGSLAATPSSNLWTYARGAVPCYAVGLLVDRLYQYARFGSLWNTYISVFASEQRQIDPALPPNFPWTTPLRVGILGPLFSPEKSIFLFDPLLILALLLAIFLWRRLAPEIKAYLSAGFILVALYILFYARFYDWSGDFAWGDRYVSTAVELVAFISVPLLLRHRRGNRRAVLDGGARPTGGQRRCSDLLGHVLVPA